MSEYILKDKISVSEDFLEDVLDKSWQDIEYLKNQISNIDDKTEQDKLFILLLNNLLTSYYIFTGCVENLSLGDTIIKPNQEIVQPETPIVPEPNFEADFENVTKVSDIASTTNDNFEPFEYFVDFDEPVGEKITDEDLYNI